jgi:hypothetical protein
VARKDRASSKFANLPGNRTRKASQYPWGGQFHCPGEGSLMKLTVELSENEAWALAEMCRRFDRDHAIRLADAFDDGAEMQAMLDAIRQIRWRLKEIGYQPS